LEGTAVPSSLVDRKLSGEERCMNSFGVSLFELLDEKGFESISELVVEMNKNRRHRPLRRRCPGYTVGDVVEIVRAETFDDMPRTEFRMVHIMAAALGLDDEEAKARLSDPIWYGLRRNRADRSGG
jgi:hypothetical protein